jgi:hypothetical protein
MHPFIPPFSFSPSPYFTSYPVYRNSNAVFLESSQHLTYTDIFSKLYILEQSSPPSSPAWCQVTVSSKHSVITDPVTSCRLSTSSRCLVLRFARHAAVTVYMDLCAPLNNCLCIFLFDLQYIKCCCLHSSYCCVVSVITPLWSLSQFVLLWLFW